MGVDVAAPRSAVVLQVVEEGADVFMGDGGRDVVHPCEEVSYAAKSVIAGVAVLESGLCTVAEYGVDWLEDSVHDKCGEGGREGASLVNSFLHGDRVPGGVLPFVVYSGW